MGKTDLGWVAIGGAAIVTAGLIVYYVLTKKVGAEQYLLQIQASEGGTTDPPPSPSGILKPAGAVVTITAKPNAGYTVGTWLLDGVEVGNQQSIQVTMNMNHSVIVTFWEGGVEPPSYPVAITCVNSVQVLGYYGCRVTLGVLNSIQDISVHNCDQNWTWDSWADYPITFKVIDSSGKGVPNIPVILYPDMFPDTGKYSGYLALNDQMITRDNPLRLMTDQNGLVTVNLSYWYGLNDHLLQLCQDAELYLWEIFPPIPVPIVVMDYGAYDGGVFLSKGGEGITGQNPKMGSFILNNVRAQVEGTSIPTAQGLAYCGFHVKML